MIATNVYLVLDGLMLVHWKDRNNTVDVLVPDVDHHEKNLFIDGVQNPLGKVHYTMTSSASSGDPLNERNTLRHCCLSGREVQLGGAEPDASFKGLGHPTAMYGLSRYVTSSILFLGGEKFESLHRPTMTLPGVVCFCETIVLQYDSLTISDGSSTTKVTSSLVVQSVRMPGSHHSPGSAAKFNALLRRVQGGGQPNFKVTELDPKLCIRAVDDPIPSGLTLPGNITRRLRTIEGQDCAPGYLIGS